MLADRLSLRLADLRTDHRTSAKGTCRRWRGLRMPSRRPSLGSRLTASREGARALSRRGGSSTERKHTEDTGCASGLGWRGGSPITPIPSLQTPLMLTIVPRTRWRWRCATRRVGALPVSLGAGANLVGRAAREHPSTRVQRGRVDRRQPSVVPHAPVSVLRRGARERGLHRRHEPRLMDGRDPYEVPPDVRRRLRTQFAFIEPFGSRRRPARPCRATPPLALVNANPQVVDHVLSGTFNIIRIPFEATLRNAPRRRAVAGTIRLVVPKNRHTIS